MEGVLGAEVADKGGRPGFPRARRDLLTRSWAASGVAARTRQVMWVVEREERRRWRMCAPRAPVAPVRSWWGDQLVGSSWEIVLVQE